MRGRYNSADAVDAAKNQVPLIVFRSNKPMDKGKNGARYFRNPPQPHMCIQDFIEDTNEPCFINVLSWVKISTPRKPEDPIPLYGGMQVPHNSSAALSLSSHFGAKGQPVIFAVMANPEILRLSGKSAPDPSDRDALVELMIDFVEAMNPEIRFKRRFTVLRDRDLAGELKDIWLAVQAKRERERGENGKRSESDKCRENRENSWREEARHRGSKSSDRIPDRATQVPVSMHDHERIDDKSHENTVNSQEGCKYDARGMNTRVAERQFHSAKETSSISMSTEAHLLTPSADPSCNKNNQSIGAMNYGDESVYSLIRSHYAEEFQSIAVDEEDPTRQQNSMACTDHAPRDNASESAYPVYSEYSGECHDAQAVDDVNSSQVIVQSNSSAFAKYKRSESDTDSDNIFSSADSNIHESLVLTSSPVACEHNTPFKEKENMSIQEEKSNLRNSNSGLCVASVEDHIFSGYAGEEVFSSGKSQVPNVAGRGHENLLPNLNDSQGVKFAIGTDHNSTAVP